MLEIDGSRFSGSGTILRYGLTLSCILNKDLRIYNIRSKRQKSGLRPQHLKTVEAFKDLAEAEVYGAAVDAHELIFRPRNGHIKTGNFNWDIGTAGSTTMMGQALLPLVFLAKGPSVYRITGGLFQDFAPNAFHLKYVLFELLKRFNLYADLNIILPGYVPNGNGIIEIKVKPAGKITPFKLTEQGKIIKVEGISLSSHLKERRVSERMADECKRILEKRSIKVNIQILHNESANQKGAALAIWALTDTGCIIGSDMAGKLGRTSEQIGQKVALQLLSDLDSGATVDRYIADQLIIYAALAKGESQYRIPMITDHVRSNLWLIQDFLGAKTNIDGNLLQIAC